MLETIGTIGFDNLKIKCIIGTEAHERDQEQEIYVDLRVDADFTAAGKSDDIQDTINYVALGEICRQTAQSGRYFLIEKYATEVINAIFAALDVKSVWILVKKPKAIADTEVSLVELKRTKIVSAK